MNYDQCSLEQKWGENEGHSMRRGQQISHLSTMILLVAADGGSSSMAFHFGQSWIEWKKPLGPVDMFCQSGPFYFISFECLTSMATLFCVVTCLRQLGFSGTKWFFMAPPPVLQGNVLEWMAQFTLISLINGTVQTSDDNLLIRFEQNARNTTIRREAYVQLA